MHGVRQRCSVGDRENVLFYVCLPTSSFLQANLGESLCLPLEKLTTKINFLRAELLV